MLASLLLASALAVIPRGLVQAENTSVIVREHINERFLVDDEGNPTDDGEVKDKYNFAACSGFVAYSKGTTEVIVTARHCTGEAFDKNDFTGTTYQKTTLVPTSVQFFDGDRGIVRRVVQGTADDLAILTVTSMRRHEYAYLDTSPIYRGESLFAFGQPQQEAWSYAPAMPTQGAVEFDSRLPFAQHTLLLACPVCAPGISGGPVVNDAGRVVGMVIAGDDHTTAILPSARIAIYLRAYH